jgi:hypothetical protein
VWTPSSQPPGLFLLGISRRASLSPDHSCRASTGQFNPKPRLLGPCPHLCRYPSISVWPASRLSAACALPSHGLRCFDSEDQRACHHQRRESPRCPHQGGGPAVTVRHRPRLQGGEALRQAGWRPIGAARGRAAPGGPSGRGAAAASRPPTRCSNLAGRCSACRPGRHWRHLAVQGTEDRAGCCGQVHQAAAAQGAANKHSSRVYGELPPTLLVPASCSASASPCPPRCTGQHCLPSSRALQASRCMQPCRQDSPGVCPCNWQSCGGGPLESAGGIAGCLECAGSGSSTQSHGCSWEALL